ncbi:MAG: hypothetical protein JKY01_10885, partial [Pseudomonadales bacterium]|nr:hypothetical protein [Pseudomonadales bacterium]
MPKFTESRFKVNKTLSKHIRDALLEAGIDPERKSHFSLGWPKESRFKWMPRFLLMLVFYAILELQSSYSFFQINVWVQSFLYLFVGLFLIQAACQALLQATIAMASRINLNHYVAATVGEIVATLP